MNDKTRAAIRTLKANKDYIARSLQSLGYPANANRIAAAIDALEEQPEQEKADPRRERLEIVSRKEGCYASDIIDEAIKMMDEQKKKLNDWWAQPHHQVESLDRITELEKELEGRGVPYDELMGKLEEASRERDTAQSQMEDIANQRDKLLKRIAELEADHIVDANKKVSCKRWTAEELYEAWARGGRANIPWPGGVDETRWHVLADAINEGAIPELTDELIEKANKAYRDEIVIRYKMAAAAKVLRQGTDGN